jgi:hypothetical protein
LIFDQETHGSDLRNRGIFVKVVDFETDADDTGDQLASQIKRSLCDGTPHICYG